VFCWPLRRGRVDRSHRGVPRRAGVLAARLHRRPHRPADGTRTGPQARVRGRPGAQHRWHGRVLARPHRHPGRARRDARHHGAHRRSPGRGGYRLPRRTLRRLHPHRRRPEGLEFNARFGDPETQVVLPGSNPTSPRSCSRPRRVVLPTSSSPGATSGPSRWCLRAADIPATTTRHAYHRNRGGRAAAGRHVYHAGTRLTEDGLLLTAGGRVLNVTALGPDFSSARKRAYEAVARISFDGMFYRSDIGARPSAVALPGWCSVLPERVLSGDAA
jgi:hypothetical protein